MVENVVVTLSPVENIIYTDTIETLVDTSTIQVATNLTSSVLVLDSTILVAETLLLDQSFTVTTSQEI
jgi:hypothetical protein